MFLSFFAPACGHSFRYEIILEHLAEIIQKREDEKNKFKLEAERRRVRCCFLCFLCFSF